MSQAIPAFTDLFVNARLNRVYRELRRLESRIERTEPREGLSEDLERIEAKVRHMRIPSRNARTLYTLRHHVSLVRERLGG